VDITMESEQSTVREGFRVVKTTFTVPENIGQLDPQSKRKATICNLFVNHQLAIADVVRLLDESYARTINVLIEQEVLQDRRSASRTADDSSSRLRLRFRFKNPGSPPPEPKR
jgi:hypothetical protein